LISGFIATSATATPSDSLVVAIRTNPRTPIQMYPGDRDKVPITKIVGAIPGSQVLYQGWEAPPNRTPYRGPHGNLIRNDENHVAYVQVPKGNVQLNDLLKGLRYQVKPMGKRVEIGISVLAGKGSQAQWKQHTLSIPAAELAALPRKFSRAEPQLAKLVKRYSPMGSELSRLVKAHRGQKRIFAVTPHGEIGNHWSLVKGMTRLQQARHAVTRALGRRSR